jgi:hypothetical protein
VALEVSVPAHGYSVYTFQWVSSASASSNPVLDRLLEEAKAKESKEKVRKADYHGEGDDDEGDSEEQSETAAPTTDRIAESLAKFAEPEPENKGRAKAKARSSPARAEPDVEGTDADTEEGADEAGDTYARFHHCFHQECTSA